MSTRTCLLWQWVEGVLAPTLCNWLLATEAHCCGCFCGSLVDAEESGLYPKGTG